LKRGEFFCETETRSFLAAHITDDIMTDAYRIDFSNEPVFHAFPSFSKECQIYFRKQRHLQRFLKVMVNLQKSKDLGWGLNHPWFEAVEAEAAEGFDDVIEQTR